MEWIDGIEKHLDVKTKRYFLLGTLKKPGGIKDLDRLNLYDIIKNCVNSLIEHKDRPGKPIVTTCDVYLGLFQIRNQPIT